MQFLRTFSPLIEGGVITEGIFTCFGLLSASSALVSWLEMWCSASWRDSEWSGPQRIVWYVVVGNPSKGRGKEERWVFTNCYHWVKRVCQSEERLMCATVMCPPEIDPRFSEQKHGVQDGQLKTTSSSSAEPEERKWKYGKWKAAKFLVPTQIVCVVSDRQSKVVLQRNMSSVNRSGRMVQSHWAPF